MKRQATTTQFFYQNGKLVTVNKGGQQRAIFRSTDIPLAELSTGERKETGLLEVDQSGSVLKVSGDSDEQKAHSYSAYGHDPSLLSKHTMAGFNGEHLDAAAGYLLGNGYRLFSPALMRFLSTDYLSPFENGGLNAYCYCLCDPINHLDPSGHSLIPNFLRTNRSLLSITAKKLNKNTSRSWRAKSLILTGKVPQRYEPNINQITGHTVILPDRAIREILNLDIKEKRYLDTIFKLWHKTGKYPKLDIFGEHSETIRNTNREFYRAILANKSSHAGYQAWLKKQPSKDKSVLGYFTHFNDENLEQTRIRRGLES